MNFAIGREQIFVASDTLVTAGNKPAGFTTKVVAIPHLRMATGGMGDHATVASWVNTLLTSFKYSDIEDVDQDAPSYLARAYSKLRPPAAQAPTTVFLFGFNREDAPVVFRYDSEKQSASERLLPDVYINPYPLCKFAPALELVARERSHLTSRLQFWSDQIKTCASILRWRHRELPDSIGGRVQCTVITPDSIHQSWGQELQELVDAEPPPVVDAQ